jgi:hypothetical protein
VFSLLYPTFIIHHLPTPDTTHFRRNCNFYPCPYIFHSILSIYLNSSPLMVYILRSIFPLAPPHFSSTRLIIPFFLNSHSNARLDALMSTYLTSIVCTFNSRVRRVKEIELAYVYLLPRGEASRWKPRAVGLGICSHPRVANPCDPRRALGIPCHAEESSAVYMRCGKREGLSRGELTSRASTRRKEEKKKRRKERGMHSHITSVHRRPYPSGRQACGDSWPKVRRWESLGGF